jgi:hypothetical protein
MNSEPTKKNGKSRNKKAKIDEKTGDNPVYVVLPDPSVHNVDPLVTESRQEFEERLLEFDSPNDYVSRMDVNADVGKALVEFNKLQRDKHAQQPVHTAVLPCLESGKKPFVTSDPNAVNQFLMSVDPFAHTVENNTLAEANRLIQTYYKSNNEECKSIKVETVNSNDDDDESIDSPSVGDPPSDEPPAAKMAAASTTTSQSEIIQRVMSQMLGNSKNDKQHQPLYGGLSGLPVAKTGQQTMFDYTTPEKKHPVNPYAKRMSPPDPPKQKDASVVFANYHPSFTPLEMSSPSNPDEGDLKPKSILKNSPTSVVSSADGQATNEPLLRASNRQIAGRMSGEELIARYQSRNKEALSAKKYDIKMTYFAPVPGEQDFVAVACQFVRPSDGAQHWQLKWKLLAVALLDYVPRFPASRMWLKTLTSVGIRDMPYGRNEEKRNTKDFPESQGLGMIAIADIQQDEQLNDVVANVAHDLKLALASREVQEKYLSLLNQEAPNLRSIIKNEMRNHSVDKRSKQSVWDDFQTATIKVEFKPAFDASLLDRDIADVSTALYGAESPSNPWSEEVKRSCFRNGVVPSKNA